MRVGIGYDIHCLAEDRPLRLGGVTIPYERGLLGHSDADVVLHAVADALLGAAGLPDIGELFPDTDPRYKNAESGYLLYEAFRRARSNGWCVENVDIIVHAERPKLSAFKRLIAESIATLLETDPTKVSVKAKTNEGMDAVGRGEAIACTAVVLLST